MLANGLKQMTFKAEFDCTEEEPGVWYSRDEYTIVWEDGKSVMTESNLGYGNAPDYNE